MTQDYWHLHHTTLIEPLTEPIENRIKYIRRNKPASEIETRLRLMRPASVKASEARAVYDKAMSKARAVYDKATSKAWAVYYKAKSKAWAVYDKAAYDKAESGALAVSDKAMSEAWAVYDKAMSEARADLERLHKLECVPDCPWDGWTIFPGAEL